MNKDKTKMDDLEDDIYGRHPKPKEQVKEVDILEENKRLKEVNKLLVDTLQGIVNEIEPIPVHGNMGRTIPESLVLSKAKAALKEANLIK